jgi:hypothetical protein
MLDFPDARFAGDQYEPTGTRVRVLPSAQKEVELFVAAEQWRQALRMVRLKSVLDPAGPNHLPHASRLVESLQLLQPEIAVFEQPAEQAISIGGD